MKLITKWDDFVGKTVEEIYNYLDDQIFITFEDAVMNLSEEVYIDHKSVEAGWFSEKEYQKIKEAENEAHQKFEKNK